MNNQDNSKAIFAYVRDFNGRPVAAIAATSPTNIGVSVIHETDDIPQIERENRVKVAEEETQENNGHVYRSKEKFKVISAKVIGRNMALENAKKGVATKIPNRQIILRHETVNAKNSSGSKYTRAVTFSAPLRNLIDEQIENLRARAEKYFQ